jgi:cytochrome bd-type quinol oxidase subunit 2
MKSGTRFIRACAGTQLTALLLVVLASAPCVASYRYHGSEIGYALGDIPGLIVSGSVVIFVPTLLYAAALTGFGIRGIRRKSPAWALYLIAVTLTTVVFFAFVSLSPRPIPDIAMYFRQEAPSVRRPALSTSEVPLLIISLVAGLAGAWVCARVLRRDLQRGAQPGASPNGGPATRLGNSGVTEGPPSVS